MYIKKSVYYPTIWDDINKIFDLKQISLTKLIFNGDLMGQEFLKITDPEEVEKIISKIPINRKVEKIPLDEAYRRVLAEDVYASINLPPFRRASMDGYAVISKDTYGASEDDPASLKLIDVVLAGDTPESKVEEGTCIEVSTGAPVPEGADAVIMIEFAEKKEEDILMLESVPMGANIVNEGADVKDGELLLQQGELITPDKIGVLSAIGLSEVPVYTKPRVAVISTGNEVIKLDEELKYGKIYDINSYTISNAVKSCGCIPIHSDVVKDEYSALKNKINEFEDADVIITSGGTSAGAGDILKVVLDDMGEVLVHGIAVKPGKPTLIGLIQDEEGKKINKIIFGLPGYPVAALMIFYNFVAPFLRKFTSLDEITRERSREFKLSRRYIPSRGRRQYVLVKIEDDQARPILKDSGAITALAEADGYFIAPKDVEIFEKGTYVNVFPLEIY
jgi:molybdopterin molybdotransferase